MFGCGIWRALICSSKIFNWMWVADKQIVATDANEGHLGPGGYELVVPSSAGGSRILGSRELAPYYKQNPKPVDSRQSVIINTLIAKYQNLQISAGVDPRTVLAKPSEKATKFAQRSEMNLQMKNNVICDLPRNVPYWDRSSFLQSQWLDAAPHTCTELNLRVSWAFRCWGQQILIVEDVVKMLHDCRAGFCVYCNLK